MLNITKRPLLHNYKACAFIVSVLTEDRLIHDESKTGVWTLE